MYQISDESVKILIKNMICLFKADESKMVDSVSAAASVFVLRTTPRRVRLRSSNYAATGPSSLKLRPIGSTSQKLRRDRSVFADATPRQIRLRSTSYELGASPFGLRPHKTT